MPVFDIQGPHHVVYPASKADVATAMSMTQGRRRIYRSGRQVAKQDIQDGTGAIVIDLSDLSGVKVSGTTVRAEAAVTNEVLAKLLSKNGLALPLSDSSRQSIASSVLRGESRLVRTLGAWSKHITSIRAVRPNGTTSTFKAKGEASALDQMRATDAVMVELTFQAQKARPLWMTRSTFPYPDAELSALAESLFVVQGRLPSGVDLVLDSHIGMYGVPMVTITALGRGAKRAALRGRIDAALEGLPLKFKSHIYTEEANGTEVVDSIAEARFGTFSDDTLETDRDGDVETDPAGWREFATRVTDGFVTYLSSPASDDGELFSRLFVNANDDLEVAHHEIRSRRSGSRATSVSKRMALHSMQASLALPLALRSKSGPIPGFEGKVYTRSKWGYARHARQYATSSFPSAKMRPFLVAYPRSVGDIKAALAYARDNEKSVVARSGGHQYTGKSSGGSDTIVLSMDRFDEVLYEGGVLKLGPAARLNTLAKGNVEHEVTFPHGECPKVAIGGHAQTGGYGHLVRGFGLALDYVAAFQMVLADGTVRTVSRPDPDQPATTAKQKLNAELYWGVLGGNAGSFGIVTQYTFDLIKDSDHKKSYRYDAIRKYKKSVYTKLMDQAQAWTAKVAAGTLSDNLDFMMTVESSGRSPFPVLLVELVHKNRTSEQTSGMKEFNEVVKVAHSGMSWWERKREEEGPLPLSKISNSFVRRWPMTTWDGREFPHPYKKRINCTMHPLSDEFVSHFVDLVDDVVTGSSGVKLVFQMLFGGGEYKAKGRTATSIPQRDYVYCFVFDLFYKSGHEQDAIDFQQRMQQVVDTHFSPEQERRVFWGTFGQASDTKMKRPQVQKMFYDSGEQYARLQALKHKVDEDDLFHTTLTVQLP